MRLNRFLAAAGLGSRRSCEELILSGQVTINGVVRDQLATAVGPNDVVKVGNRVLHAAAPVTILLHKPPGFICTASDTHNRQTVFNLLPPHFPRLFHVGRLDRESEGLLILTNDGSLSLKLTHPRYKVDKEYEVVLDQPFDFERAPKLLHGISLEEGWAKAEEVHRLAANKLKVILRQGMKRQIRLMFHALGYEVKKLVRVRIGNLAIGHLPPGAWRALTQKEIDALLAEGAQTAVRRPAPPRFPAARPGPRPASRKPRPAPPKEERPRPGGPRRHRDDVRGGDSPKPRRPGSFQRGESPRPPRRPSKPFKAAGSRPAAPKKPAKAGPHPFAKFVRRRGEEDS